MDIRNVEELVALGREAVWKAFKGEEILVPEFLKEKYKEKRGIFTTLKRYPDEELRGCIGVPLPIYPLWYGTVYTSLSSAFKDPRFKPLEKEEFDKTLWEITLLSVPEEFKGKKEKLPRKIEIGKHGLIVEAGGRSGLLLPQVAVEHGLSPEEFLSLTCLKAGLPKDCWKKEEVKVYTFTGEVFKEKEPFGEIEVVPLK
ncbi:TIGR00296 family protein [Aquifex pyrophilus]